TVTTTTAVSTTTTQERKSTMSTTSATKPATTTAPAVPYPHVALDNPALKYTGRTMVVPGEAYLDWSASGLELAVTGGTVEAQLYGVDLGDNNQRVYMAVYVNGRRTKTFYLENGLAWYTLAETLPENTVSAVRLVRLTEASQGKASLFDLKVTGKLAPRPADKPHRIEWIGDSLTCGYGVLGASQADPFLASTEDVTKTYAWLCAEALNAEMSVVAASGYGIGSNWAGKEEQLIPDVFPYYNSLSRSITEKWEYSRYQPELVVINLGTNDFNGCQGSDEGASRVRKGIVRFLTALRAAYPDATICWVYGFCGDGYGNVIRQSVEAFAAADGNAAYIPVSVQNAAKNGYGSGWHPNAASNEDCAAELLPQLKKLMNW
ncbi:MAG: hypothetical protein IJZ13_04650, partial [Clostridia bacterium]|nr:hypothetical protein [Clostridia bacterium]